MTDTPLPEVPVAEAEIRGRHYELAFPLEVAGVAAGASGRLVRYVCEECRRQNARGRNEWMSAVFPDSDDQEAIDRAEAAFEEVKAHVRMHELIGQWMYEQIRASLAGIVSYPTPDRFDYLDPTTWKAMPRVPKI